MDDRFQFDVVVVGCGMAGLAAGLGACEEGADVAVLEKAPKDKRGGQTQFTEGIRIPAKDVDELEVFNENYSKSDLYSDIMRITKGEADPNLTKTLTDNAAETTEWLGEMGVDWDPTPPSEAGNYGGGHVWHDSQQLLSSLIESLEERGAEVFYDAEVYDLERNESGAVDTVRVRLDGVARDFTARSVVLASGGYEANKKMRGIYYGEGFESMKVRGSRYLTGEVIEIALDMGAKAEGQWTGAHMALIDAGAPDFEGGVNRIDGYTYGVIVNHDGERFVDEGEDFRTHTYAKFGRRIFEQPYHEAFIIVDDGLEEHITHHGPSNPITADSIESLARRLDIEDVQQTKSTIEAYNEACDPGEFDPTSLDGNSTDGISPRKSNWAMPIEEPPFYGYPVTGGITFSFGGIATDTGARVLDTRDEPIEGLYAAGNCTGGILYNNYPAGTALVKAAVFGKIAGENAAKSA